MKAPVPAKQVPTFDDITEPGDFIFPIDKDGNPDAVTYCCPCGCGAVRCAPFRKAGRWGSQWDWNGDRARPTLTPSIQAKTGCCWHGHLTEGFFISC